MVMTTWSVTITHCGGVEIFSGSAPTWGAARTAALAAARECHRHGAVTPGRCYTLHIEGQALAIIAAGVDESGEPAHADVAQLLDSLDTPPVPPSLDPTALLSCSQPAPLSGRQSGPNAGA